ncbi:FAD/NAD(P)-binding protein [Streptomyces sp. SAJ15]|uniref:FAD/NAD(P)-binding protein n=1 Tax=Streptomyces sp. SAJ15 TaxID=2011095 RepID=UPI0011856BF8|nr:FAD/NAD(P)-binding protein [Streptomyces sp. SAJ15]TVL92480.1 hypothetical protein CD790_12430 [Streptomyces sp. SAJ15]
MRSMGRDVVVIGGGAAGASVFVQLVAAATSAEAREEVRTITVVDPRQIGWGLAFGDDDPLLLCDTAVGINSLLPNRPDDFADYLRSTGWQGRREDCVERSRMAEYCHHRYLRARDRAVAHGIEVRHVRDLALAVEVVGEGRYAVVSAGGGPVPATDVVVCTGVRTPRVPAGFDRYTRVPRFLESPYPASRVRALRDEHPAGARVLVVGTRQSAVDAALLLCRDGHRTVMTSPSGRLPAVRTSLGPPARARFPPLERIPRIDPDDPLLEWKVMRRAVEAVRSLGPRPLREQISTETDPERRLREEIALVDSDACQWEGAMVSLIETLIDFAPALPPGRLQRLLDENPWFTGRYATALTVVNARRLLDHFESGALTVAPGYPDEVAYEAGPGPGGLGGGWRVGWPDGTVDRFDHVVSGTGFHPPVLHRERGGGTLHLAARPPMAAAEPVEWLGPSLRLLPERIWVCGVGTHMRIPFANHLRNVTRQASWVVDQLTGRGGGGGG